MNKTEFFEILYKLNGISSVGEEMCNMLTTFQPGISDDALIVFAMYFSLERDGNVCVCLEPKKLAEKWAEKWVGLIVAADLDEEQTKEYKGIDFTTIIQNGVRTILNELNKIVTKENDKEPEKLFVIKRFGEENWLFTTKYYHALKSVNEKLSLLLKHESVDNLSEEKKNVIKFFKEETSHDKPIILNDKQAEAVVRGQKENLIISGGPGYGKTTVVCYLLWKLLENSDILEKYTIYLAAPSGKAQDRLKESINDELKRLEHTDSAIFEKLTNAQNFTIHRLLNYNPQDNRFRYNKEHQFPKESIFVVDEASMIDICMFQKLLEAIPEGARLFILGDPYQLPSVQAGAVLGDILDSSNIKVNNIVELVQSNRFGADSVLGELAKKIKEQSNDDFEFSEWSPANDGFNLNNEDKSYPVHYISLNKEDKKVKKAQLNEIAEKWALKFCNYSKDCKLKADVTENDLDVLWKKVNSARILCAERRGKVGVETLNKLVSDRVRNKQSGEFYPGQQLIITQNQRLFDLYNGDCGVVVTFEGDNTKYLMLEKPKVNNGKDGCAVDDSIKRIGRYMFYPIYVLPKDAIEMAFAITIHKSQGSGYENIMVFIPEKLEHPLLNNQIIYTAVTRSKGCTYIVGNNETMKKAIATKIVRDTKIKVV